MFVIGLLLVLAALAAGAAVAYDGTESLRVELFGRSAEATVATIFFAGVVATAIFFLGIWLMQGSVARARRRREARNELREEHRSSVRNLEQERAQLAEENARLAQQLERERAAAAGRPGSTGPAAPSGPDVPGGASPTPPVGSSTPAGTTTPTGTTVPTEPVPVTEREHPGGSGLFGRHRGRHHNGSANGVDTAPGRTDTRL